MLLIDTNILARCSRGRAMDRLEVLRMRSSNLATTDRNAVEFKRILQTVFGLPEVDATVECDRVTAVMHVIPEELYDDRRREAARRLGKGGQSDWPLLAAALAFGADIWTEDRAFFGVGVPVWHSETVLFRENPGR